VLFEISSDPLIVAGKATFISDAIELVGAKNAFADLAAGYPRPSLEEAVRRDPDVIIIPTVRPDSADFKTEVGAWQRFGKMKAVRAGKIKSVPSDLLLRPSPRILQGIIALEHAIFTH
jgi:ABC-type Fe3+-hydroxamate transport system substrate-binding protein